MYEHIVPFINHGVAKCACMQQIMLNGLLLDPQSGPNPTTSIYNATGSLARFENKNSISSLKNAPAYHNVGVVAVN
jgi:hypothetical protein